MSRSFRVVLVLALGLLAAPLLPPTLPPAAAAQDGAPQEGEHESPPDAVRPIPDEERGQVRDWYVVTLRDGAPDAGAVATDLARTDGLLISHVYRAALRGFAAKIPPQAVERIRRRPDVLGIAPSIEFQFASQTVPDGIRRVEAAPAFKNALADIDGDGGQVDVDVAVIDGGIDDHPDLNDAGVAGVGGVGSARWTARRQRTETRPGNIPLVCLFQ